MASTYNLRARWIEKRGPREGRSENRVRLAPHFRRPLQTLSHPWLPHDRELCASVSRQQLAAGGSSRRRSVPPSLSEEVSQSRNQRWRERPRCPAPPVTPGRRDGVVHAIAGRVPCRPSRSVFVQEDRARPRARVGGSIRPDKLALELVGDLDAPNRHVDRPECFAITRTGRVPPASRL